MTGPQFWTKKIKKKKKKSLFSCTGAEISKTSVKKTVHSIYMMLTKLTFQGSSCAQGPFKALCLILCLKCSILFLKESAALCTLVQNLLNLPPLTLLHASEQSFREAHKWQEEEAVFTGHLKSPKTDHPWSAPWAHPERPSRTTLTPISLPLASHWNSHDNSSLSSAPSAHVNPGRFSRTH